LARIRSLCGPAGRRFGNNYTRLFVRYPGLEESKLGAEGLSAMEKVKLGYDITQYLDVGLVARYTDTHYRYTGDDFDPVTFASTPGAQQS